MTEITVEKVNAWYILSQDRMQVGAPTGNDGKYPTQKTMYNVWMDEKLFVLHVGKTKRLYIPRP